eukprot:1159180-Pelagomonas_calceolata.AAC.6
MPPAGLVHRDSVPGMECDCDDVHAMLQPGVTCMPPAGLVHRDSVPGMECYCDDVHAMLQPIVTHMPPAGLVHSLGLTWSTLYEITTTNLHDVCMPFAGLVHPLCLAWSVIAMLCMPCHAAAKHPWPARRFGRNDKHAFLAQPALLAGLAMRTSMQGMWRVRAYTAGRPNTSALSRPFILCKQSSTHAAAAAAAAAAGSSTLMHIAETQLTGLRTRDCMLYRGTFCAEVHVVKKQAVKELPVVRDCMVWRNKLQRDVCCKETACFK